MLAYLIEKNKQMDNFYTSNGISVYVKEPLTNGLDIEEIMQYIEERLPRKFLSEVEMVIIGQFPSHDLMGDIINNIFSIILFICDIQAPISIHRINLSFLIDRDWETRSGVS